MRILFILLLAGCVPLQEGLMRTPVELAVIQSHKAGDSMETLLAETEGCDVPNADFQYRMETEAGRLMHYNAPGSHGVFPLYKQASYDQCLLNKFAHNKAERYND